MSGDPLQALLAAGMVPTVAFPLTSRYAEVGVASHIPDAAPGEEAVPVAFLRRRLVPRPERFATLYEVSTVELERRDLIAARHLGDPELWWRLADANGVIDPEPMTAPVGRVIRITLPVDVPGGGDG